jgi:hypothetical protein
VGSVALWRRTGRIRLQSLRLDLACPHVHKLIVAAASAAALLLTQAAGSNPPRSASCPSTPAPLSAPITGARIGPNRRDLFVHTIAAAIPT